MTNEDFKRWTKWDDALGTHLLPLSPTTLVDDGGLPIGRSFLDYHGNRQFKFTEGTRVGQQTTSWDDARKRWATFTIIWDGAVPESQWLGTPGNSKGLLCAGAPSLETIDFPLTTAIQPRRDVGWVVQGRSGDIRYEAKGGL